ncbi:hypothetical protein ABZ319_17180, partial [Nocardia sp. NPDC005978]|uniref:hypothetical protein n=1 Tax=Nocardia sp. NPDC005978 TaxID=3156725 RepID=UPI0033B26FDF
MTARPASPPGSASAPRASASRDVGHDPYGLSARSAPGARADLEADPRQRTRPGYGSGTPASGLDGGPGLGGRIGTGDVSA